MQTSFAAALALAALSGCAASSPVNTDTQQSQSQLLARSTPANGSTVTGPVNVLQLTFARPARLLEVTVEGPDGLSPMMITAPTETTDYQIPLPGLTSGQYRVNWRASASGRSYDGVLNFALRD